MSLNDDLFKAFQTALRFIHASKGFQIKDLKTQEVQGLVQATHRVFKEAFKKGIQDAILPKKMQASLQNNLFIFSGLKTFVQLKEVSSKLLDANGTLKPYHIFEREVLKIHTTYNKNYLKTEYNYAINSSQMASKWNDFVKNKGAYNLQYRTASDSKVREAHASLHNTTLPVDDPFWVQYYPPNGWNCRCNVVEVLTEDYKESDSEKAMQEGERATTQVNKKGENASAIFRFNPGMQGVIFPPKHPYFKIQNAEKVINVLSEEMEERIKMAEEKLKEIIKLNSDKENPIKFTREEKQAIYLKPLSEQYDTIYINRETGAEVKIHKLCHSSPKDTKGKKSKGDDFFNNIEASKILTSNGESVFILPKIHHQDKEARKLIFNGYNNPTRNPDLLSSNGVFIELKRPDKNNIVRICNSACTEQDCEALVYIPNIELSEDFIDDRINTLFETINKQYYWKNRVIIVTKNTIKIANRPL